MESDNWTPATLGDLVSIKHGWPFKSEYFNDTLTGKPIIVSIGNFQYTGGFRFESTENYEYRDEYPREYELFPGDILLVMTCQTAGGEILGVPGRIPNDGRIYLHNQRMGKVVLKRPEIASLDYLYWVFLWKEFNQELIASSTGTKIVHTAPGRIEAFAFSLPPLNEQNAIAHILGELNERIELNRQMSHTLEVMALTIFKSWFVDFDPVAAKVDGRNPYGMSDETAALFPARYEESKAGLKPTGWATGTIAEIAEYVNGKNFTKNATGKGRMVIRITELNSGPGPSTLYNEVDAQTDNIAYPDDLIFSWSGSLDVYRWHRDEGLINQHIFKVSPKKYPQWFVHFHLREAMPFFQGIAADKATTMGHIKREHLSQAELVLPPNALLAVADQVISPLYNKIHQNERESIILSDIRDRLLPKLLSGEIRLKQVERIIREVA